MKAARRVSRAGEAKDTNVTTPSEDPRRADPPAAVRATGTTRHSAVAGDGGGASAASAPLKKKGRRRKKRRSVYAPPQEIAAGGQANRAGERRSPATQAAPLPPLPRRPVHASEPSRGEGEVLYAALDLGTNNCRLLIARPRDHGFHVVDAFSRIVRLGEGVGRSGRLNDKAMERAIEALHVCQAKLYARGVSRHRLIATEACRAAENGSAFLDRVRTETGLELEIVSRETEARLAVTGCASLIDPNASGALLFDIGGGSSELVWIDLTRQADGQRRRMSDRIRTWVSLPVGVVTLSERHGGEHVDRSVFEAMVAEVAAMLAAFPQAAALDKAVRNSNLHMLGTSGTVTTLAGVHLGLPRYDRRRVDGIWLSAVDVDRMMDVIIGMDYEARVANPCIGRERADLVLAGCAILEAIRRRWPCPRLRVADRGLREGILVEMMSADGVWRRPLRQNGQAP